MKIRPVGAELFHADGQTQADKSDEGNNSFSKFRERAQKNTETPAISRCSPNRTVNGAK